MSNFEYELAPVYDPSLRALYYTPDRSVSEALPIMTEIEQRAMNMAHELGKQALADGNPPVGAVLIVNDGEHLFGAKTHDKVTGKIGGHAELVAYDDAFAAGVVRDDLSRSTLVSTANLCTTCAPPYAEAKIGKIITAAPRRFVFPLTGLMRPRQINMHELLVDGNTSTTTILNYDLDRSLALFAQYGKERGYEVPAQIDKYLVRILLVS